MICEATVDGITNSRILSYSVAAHCEWADDTRRAEGGKSLPKVTVFSPSQFYQKFWTSVFGFIRTIGLTSDVVDSATTVGLR